MKNNTRNTIRVAHIAGGLVTGGVEAVVYNYFSNMERSNYELTYICYNPAAPEMKKKFEDIGFKVYELPQRRKHFIRSCVSTYKVLKGNRVQIVHSNMTLMCFVTNMIGRLAGAKVLISHSHLALEDKGIRKITHGICKWLSCVTATDYFACGQDASDYLFGKRNRSKVTIMHNAIAVDLYKHSAKARDAIRKEIGLDQEIVLGHIGRFTDQKNHVFLLEIFKEFIRLRPDAHLILAGDGPLFESVKRKSGEMGLQKRIHFLGSRQDVPAILSAIDFLLFPSLYEGLPVILLEAQAAEVPILTSDGVDEKVNITGTVHFLSLKEPASKWAEAADGMISAPDNCSKHKINGAYDIRIQAEKLDEFYHNAVKR